MKKILLLTALLALLALPSFALAESWEEFVDAAHAAMEGQEGAVTVRGPALVTTQSTEEPEWDADAPIDPATKPLIVPDKVQLTIQGGTFEVLYLGRGDITLSGVTVTGLPDTDAILVNPQGKEGSLRLIIGEDSVISATGTGRALTDAGQWKKAGSMEVQNLGQVTAEGGAGFDLGMTSDSGNNALHLTNSGSIRSGGDGVVLLAAPEKGAASVSMENSGYIITTGNAVQLTARSKQKGTFATLENQSGALIEQTGPEGAAITMEVTDTATGKNNGQGLIINKGIVRATAEPIRLLARGDDLVPVRIQQRGLVEEASGKMSAVAFVYVYGEDGAEIPDDEAMAVLWQEWADALDLKAMAAGTRMELVYSDAQGDPQKRLEQQGEGSAERRQMTWSEFRQWAEEQLALSAGEVLRLYVNADVAAPKGMDSGRDKPLSVPTGRRLDLVDGTFAQLMIGNGDVELSDCTLTANGEGASAIYFPAGDDTMRITLTIDTGTTINATGGSLAITTDEKHKKPCHISIHNQGRLEGETGIIGLSVVVLGEREASLTLENEGKILGRGQCVSLAATTQDSPAALSILNNGVIESTGANAITLTGLSSRNSAFFTVDNGPEGNLRCSTGNVLTIRTLDPAAPATNPRERVPELEEPWGSVIIRNQGKIGGKDEPIMVESLLRALFPVEVENIEPSGETSDDGEETEAAAEAASGESEAIVGPHITTSSADYELLLTVVYHAEKEGRIIDQEAFDEVVHAHIADSYKLPDGMRGRLQLRAPATEFIEEDLYTYEEDFKSE